MSPIEAELEAAGAELAAADEAREHALERIRNAMQEGDGALPIKRMAELAGISRVTAYRMLDRPQPSRRPNSS